VTPKTSFFGLPKKLERSDKINTYVQAPAMKYEGWNFNSGNYLFTTDTK